MKILASTQQTSKDREPDITGTIVGYDTVEKHVAASTSNDNKLSDSGTEEKRLLHRVLFLPDRDRNSNDSGNFNDYAFWGTLDVTSSEEYDGLILCCSPQQQGRCDDGNTAGGDGCSEVCKVEEEHICWGEPAETIHT